MQVLIGKTLLIFSVLLGIWTGYRFLFFVPVWVDELVAKPLLQLAPIAVVVWMLEKRSWSSLGIVIKDWQKHILTGFGIGAVLILQNMLIHYVRQGHISLIPGGRDGGGIGLALLTSLATGFIEEFVFRGYFFTRFVESGKSSLLALILSSILFVIFHIPLMLFVFQYSWQVMVSYSATLFILSLVHGCIRWLTGSILPGSVAHGLWNFSNAVLR